MIKKLVGFTAEFALGGSVKIMDTHGYAVATFNDEPAFKILTGMDVAAFNKRAAPKVAKVSKPKLRYVAKVWGDYWRIWDRTKKGWASTSTFTTRVPAQEFARSCNASQPVT